MRRLLLLLLFFVIFSIPFSSGVVQRLLLNVTSDTEIQCESSSTKDDTKGALDYSRIYESKAIYSILRADFSGISGTVLNATFTATTAVITTKGNISAYIISHPWLEGTGTGIDNTAILNGSTCYERRFGDNLINGNTPYNEWDQDWQAEGLGSGTDFNSTSMGTVPVPTNNKNYTWNLTTGFIQHWFDDNTLNYGIILRGSTDTDQPDVAFGTRERTSVNDPFFEIYIETDVTDSCDCPTINTNWAIDFSDNCNITSHCNLGTGNLSFTSAGNFWVHNDIIISAGNINDTTAGTIWLNKNAIINLSS